MAERAHEVPAKYGEVNELFHPACAPMAGASRRPPRHHPVLLAALAFIFYNDPARRTPFSYCSSAPSRASTSTRCSSRPLSSSPRPVLRARKPSGGSGRTPRRHQPHHLRGKLYPKKAYGQNLETMADASRYRSFLPPCGPSRYRKAAHASRRASTGTAKPCVRISNRISAKGTIYKQINVISMDKEQRASNHLQRAAPRLAVPAC